MDNLEEDHLKEIMAIKPAIITYTPIEIIVPNRPIDDDNDDILSNLDINREDILQKMIEHNFLSVFDDDILEQIVKKRKTKSSKPSKKSKNNNQKQGDEEKEEEIALNYDDNNDNENNNKISQNKRKIKEILIPQYGALEDDEFNFFIGSDSIKDRLPPNEPENMPLYISNYFMNNRDKFASFINYEFKSNRNKEKETVITCDNMTTVNKTISLLYHQKVVRDYLSNYSPYRGLLIYHGLGSGKTCTSIGIAEGMKQTKQVMILTPASLQPNYIQELKKCGDFMYKKNKFWEWIPLKKYPDALEPMSATLNLSIEYIQKKKGAWFINYKKESNYEDLTDKQQKSIEEQIDTMISYKYKFVNYNGLRNDRANKLTTTTNKNRKDTLSDLTKGFTENPFDNKVIVIDEAHNLISMIVNKLKKDPINEDDIQDEEFLPAQLASKLYHYLMSAINCKIVLLSGTPIINYPNEFGILFNILRGYIKTWRINLKHVNNVKLTQGYIENILRSETTHDYVEYSPLDSILTITRNPLGFKSIFDKNTSKYKGVKNHKINKETGNIEFNRDHISDGQFTDNLIELFGKNKMKVAVDNIEIKYYKPLPDDLDGFIKTYINPETKQVEKVDSLRNRIIGLTSYFRSAQENLLPRFNKELDVDYHVIEIPMSDFQFKLYEEARKNERDKVKKNNKFKAMNVGKDVYSSSSSYRILSRLLCNYAVSERPMPLKADFNKIAKKAEELENKQDLNRAKEGEIEGDEILDELGGVDYKERIVQKIQNMKDNSDEYFSMEALKMYSPKYLSILKNIIEPNHIGLHLLYSQFRSVEGISLFSEVLNKNNFAKFNITKSSNGSWSIDINAEDMGKPKYAFYTGTESTEEKEIIRLIYNGEWEKIRDKNLVSQLKEISNNNNLGEVIKVLMITSSGSEGINLFNTRHVHIMEPYWHPVRSEQVIGRARRICSHRSLPKELQTVEVFVYLMSFSNKQLNSDDAIDLNLHDKAKLDTNKTITTDQYLHEISEIKASVTSQLTDIIKETSFDCLLHSNNKCYTKQISENGENNFAYVPDFNKQPSNENMRKQNVKSVKVKFKDVKINGVDYVYEKTTKSKYNVYDLESYEAVKNDPNNKLLLVGTLDIDNKGKQKWNPIHKNK